MIHQELLFYVKEEQKRGVSNATIKQVLMSEGGWVEADIDEVLSFVVAPPKKEESITPTIAPAVSSVQQTTPPSMVVSTPSVAPVVTPTASIYEPTKAGTPAFSGMQSSVMVTKAQPKHSLFTKVFVTVFILAVLGAGGAYAYMTFVNPTPTDAFSKAMVAFSKQETFRAIIEATGTLDKEALAFLPTETVQTTPLDTAQDSKVTASFSVSRDGMKSVIQGMTASLSTPLLPVAVSLQGKMVPEGFAFQFPNIGYFFDRFNLTVDTKEDAWYLLSNEDPHGIFAGAPALSLVSATGGEIGIAKLARLLVENGAITPTVALPVGMEGDIKYNRYQFSVNKGAVEKALNLFVSTVQGAPTNDIQRAQITDTLTTTEFSDGELWLTPYSFIPHKMTLKIRGGEGSVLPFESLMITLNLSGYGDVIKNETPANSVSIKKVIDDALLKAKDEAVTSLLSQARVEAEMFYSKKRSYRTLCSKSPEITGTFTEIQKVTGSIPSCFDASRAYAIASSLASDPTKIYCVDSSGTNGFVGELPTTALCK